MTQELVISTLATSDAVARLLIEKGLITEDEFLQRLWQERVTYERLLKPEPSEIEVGKKSTAGLPSVRGRRASR